MNGPVESFREGRVVRVRLNQPDSRNAFSRELCRGLLEALLAADRDEAARAILLESAGPVFTAGWDPGEVRTVEDLTLHDALLNIAAELHKPLVAAVQGPAFDPGVALIANAAVAVAAQGASFAMADIRGGVFPYIAFGPLARSIGHRRAAELCLTGRVFSVPEALSWGLVHHAAPAFEFDDRAFAIAEQIAAAGEAAAGLRFVRDVFRPRDERRLALDRAASAMLTGKTEHSLIQE